MSNGLYASIAIGSMVFGMLIGFLIQRFGLPATSEQAKNKCDLKWCTTNHKTLSTAPQPSHYTQKWCDTTYTNLSEINKDTCKTISDTAVKDTCTKAWCAKEYTLSPNIALPKGTLNMEFNRINKTTTSSNQTKIAIGNQHRIIGEKYEGASYTNGSPLKWNKITFDPNVDKIIIYLQNQNNFQDFFITKITFTYIKPDTLTSKTVTLFDSTTTTNLFELGIGKDIYMLGWAKTLPTINTEGYRKYETPTATALSKGEIKWENQVYIIDLSHKIKKLTTTSST